MEGIPLTEEGASALSLDPACHQQLVCILKTRRGCFTLAAALQKSLLTQPLPRRRSQITHCVCFAFGSPRWKTGITKDV